MQQSTDQGRGGSKAKCAVFGHDFDFHADGLTMRWQCRRGCDIGGSKNYPSAAAAERYAKVFNQRDSDDLGKRAPLIGMLPLRLWRRFRRR